MAGVSLDVEEIGDPETCQVCGEVVARVDHAARCPRATWTEQDAGQNRADHFAEPEEQPRGDLR